MAYRPFIALLTCLSMLSGCGGGGGTSGAVTASAGPGATATPTPTATSGCTLRERQDWAAAQLREWYLFPETLPTSLDPTPYASVDAYIDALTATARAQRKDRYFTYLTSIAQEDAYNASGATAGFGVRFAYDATARRAFITEAFEGAPALAAGLDRGTEILAVGTSETNLQTVASLLASGGAAALNDALGPSTAGTTRVLRVSDSAGTRTVTVAKADYALSPVSSRYGAKIITDNGRQVGYVNLRTFISTADPQLRAAFASFRAAGVTDVIVDFRYNGGGLLSIAELMGDLLGANRSTSEVFDYVTFRPEKSANNTTRTFAPQPQSIAPTRIAFIGTAATASASELVIAGMLPYLGNRLALIGTNTFGKPVGQIALDRAACDDRLRVIALALQNANRQGAYYDGLAGTVQASCQAGDDITRQMGDPAEASTRQALDFIAGRTCTPISPVAISASVRSGEVPGGGAAPVATLATPADATPAQRDVPGLF